jgi:hypothetical protein
LADKVSKDGFRVLTGAYVPTPTEPHFMLVWANDNVFRWEWFFPPAEFTKRNDHYRKEGFRPYLVYPPCEDNRGLMGVDWIHDHDHVNWQAVIDSERVSHIIRDMRAKNQYLSVLHSYAADRNKVRFTAVGWDNPDRRDWRFESEMTAA